MIIHIITGLARGGAENALYRLLSAQPNPSESHVISLTNDGVFGAKLRAVGVGVTSLGMGGFISSPRAFFTLVRLLRRLRPEVVQTWMYHSDLVGGFAARMAGVPVCWGIRNSTLSAKHTKFTTQFVVRLCALISQWIPARIVSCSARAVRVHRALGYANRFVVIPNGLDLAKFSPRSEKRAVLRRSLGLPEDGRVIGHIGRADPQKDHSSLVTAFEELAVGDPDARLVLAGNGMAFGIAYMDNLLAGSRLTPQVLALGPRDDIEDLMLVMDVFTLCSSYGEAFPNVVVEAMACGIPCVVTDVGDAAEIVGETGWVVPLGVPAALASALRQALHETPHQRAARGVRARRRIEENYSVERMVVAYRSLWNEVLDKRVKPCAD